MPYLKMLYELEQNVAKHHITYVSRPYFTALHRAFPPLINILKQLRGDTTTDPEFQEHIISILDNEDCSVRTICGLMRAYSKTHNTAPDKKPVVAIAQEISKVLSSIEGAILELEDASLHSEYLKNIIDKLRVEK